MPPAVAGGGQLADARAIHDNRLAAPRECGGIVERERHETLRQRLVLALEERVASDELCLVEPDGEAETCLPGRFVGQELRTPGAASGFDAQGIERVVTGIAQP